jgi:hypothetical protein
MPAENAACKCPAVTLSATAMVSSLPIKTSFTAFIVS